MRWVAIDIESTGLDPAVHRPWEVALVAEDGRRWSWAWTPAAAVMDRADPAALEVGQFASRSPGRLPSAHRSVEMTSRVQVCRLTDGATLVGSNPDFDARMITAWLAEVGLAPSWHYRTVDVPTMAVGHLLATGGADESLLELPWRSTDLSRACDVDPPAGELRHTAMGDAEWCWRWMHALLGTGPQAVAA